MRSPLPGNLVVTQAFGVNADEAYVKTINGELCFIVGHDGVDFNAVVGTNVIAVWDGWIEIVALGVDPAFGVHVYLHETTGRLVLYAHLDQVLAIQGQHVKAGDIIAKSGNTGNSTGPHLHFGVREATYNIHNGYGGWRDSQGGFDGKIGEQTDLSNVTLKKPTKKLQPSKP